MCTRIKTVGELCSVRAGIPTGRLKDASASDANAKVRLLVPRAMVDGRIDDGNLVMAMAEKVKESFYTVPGDVVVKLSAPYDTVYIDEAHAGIIITSFAAVLRPLPSAIVDRRYLALYLSLPQTTEALKAMSTGTAMSVLKTSAIMGLGIPALPIDDQRRLGELFVNVMERKEVCRTIMRLSDLLLESEFAKFAK